jgi:hypothetical protein
MCAVHCYVTATLFRYFGQRIPYHAGGDLSGSFNIFSIILPYKLCPIYVIANFECRVFITRTSSSNCSIDGSAKHVLSAAEEPGMRTAMAGWY